jgi:hypothetical protein
VSGTTHRRFPTNGRFRISIPRDLNSRQSASASSHMKQTDVPVASVSFGRCSGKNS